MSGSRHDTKVCNVYSMPEHAYTCSRRAYTPLRFVYAFRHTLAGAAVAALLLAAPNANAQAPNGDAATAAPAKLVEVRFALSQTASKQLSEPRLRRLIEIELGDDALLSPTATGPLGDHVAYVWVDLVEPATIIIEVRVGSRSVDRREIADAELTGDIVPRVIAIAAADMVRKQMRPVRPPKKPPPPKLPTPEEIEGESRRVDALMTSPQVGGFFVPSAGAALFGPALDVGFRRFGVGVHALAGFYTGPTNFSSARLFEVGLAASYRLWIAPNIRFAAQISAAPSALHVSGATILGQRAADLETWSARAGAQLAFEWRFHEPMWLTLQAGGSALLRGVDIVSPGGQKSAFEGGVITAAIGLMFEQRAPVQIKALQSSGSP
ncbi:MAG: hypothetical protein IPK82_12645 [Polyangiaceae bacterium]|nr:hypothetical protein [Polyangiaceae bacterium]